MLNVATELLLAEKPQTDKMAANEEHEQKMRELQRSYVDFLDDSDRLLIVLIWHWAESLTDQVSNLCCMSAVPDAYCLGTELMTS